MKRRLIIGLLAVILVLAAVPGVFATEQTHSHCICGDNPAANHEGCQQVQWVPLYSQSQAVEAGIVSDKGVWLLSGQYYLAESFALDGVLVIPDGVSVALCLNGNTLTGAGGSKRMISLYGELSVCDCGPKDRWGAMENTAETSLEKEVYGAIAYLINVTRNDGQMLPANPRMRIYGGRFTNTGAASAGGLFFLGEATMQGAVATLELYDGILTGGTAQRPEGSTKASEGGTVAVSNGSEFYMYGGRLEKGSCSTRGGHVAVFGGCTFRMTGGLIESGQAAIGGGAIYSYGATVILEGGSITDCAAVGAVNPSSGTLTDGKGGLIYTNGGKVVLSGVSLRRGSAVSDGGNVYIAGAGIVEMTAGTVTDGVSGREGGNFLVSTSATLEVSGGATIIGGMATGGGNVMSFGSVEMENCTVSGGVADNRGGNIYIFNKGNAILNKMALRDGTAKSGGNLFVGCNSNTTGSTATAVLTDCVVSDGMSFSSGGNIYAYNSGTLILERTKVVDGVSFNNAGNIMAYIDNSYKDPNRGSLTVIDSAVTDGLALGIGDCVYSRVDTVLKGVVRITTESDARNPGLYLPSGYTVDGSGLKPGSLVDVSIGDVQKPFSLTGGGVNYFRGYTRRLRVTEQDGALYLKIPEVAVCEGQNEVARYSYLEYAQNYHVGENQYIKLLADRDEDVILNDDVYVDLNGFDFSGSVELAGHRFYGMDSTTNLYDGANVGVLTATFTDGGKPAAPAGDTRSEAARTGSIYRYLAVPETAGWSFHRIYLGIDMVRLRTDSAGLSYRSLFAGDEAVQAYLDEAKGFGLALSIKEIPKELKDFSYFPAKSFATGVANARTTTLANVLRTNAKDNGVRAETVIYGRAFLQTADGHLVMSQPVAMTFRQTVELLDSRYDTLSKDQQGYLERLYKTYVELMSGWGLENIGKQEEKHG